MYIHVVDEKSASLRARGFLRAIGKRKKKRPWGCLNTRRGRD